LRIAPLLKQPGLHTNAEEKIRRNYHEHTKRTRAAPDRRSGSALTANAGNGTVNLHGTCKPSTRWIDRGEANQQCQHPPKLRSGRTDGTVNMRDLRLVYDSDADKISVYNIATGETCVTS
jgi:hypothetical protein